MEEDEDRGRRRRGPPLARLSGAVRMMNGRPVQAVRALMGAAELYITLLSVCERLLKALKSPGTDTATKLPQTAANDSVSRVKSSRAETKGKRPRRYGRALREVRR